MTALTTHAIKTFLLTGLYFGIIMSIFNWNWNFNPKIFLFMMFAFGLFMAIFNYVVLKSNLKEIAITNPTSDDLKSKQHRSVPSSLTKEELLPLLEKQTWLRKIRLSEDGKSILANSRTSSFSWGEKINLEPKNNEIIISSKPLLFTNIFDAGKNLKNVIQLEKLIASA